MNKTLHFVGTSIVLSLIVFAGFAHGNSHNSEVVPPESEEALTQEVEPEVVNEEVSEIEVKPDPLPTNPNKPVNPPKDTPKPPVEEPKPEAPVNKVTVTAFQLIPINDKESDCQLTYSDGTTKRWEYKRVFEGTNGAKTVTRTIGKCDSSLIGQEKA